MKRKKCKEKKMTESIENKVIEIKCKEEKNDKLRIYAFLIK